MYPRESPVRLWTGLSPLRPPGEREQAMAVAEAQPRGRMLGVRAGPDLHRWLSEASEQVGLTRSELMRLLLRRASEQGLPTEVLAAAEALKTARCAG